MTRDTARQITALLLVTSGFFLILGGCGSGSASLRTLTTFTGSGNRVTAHFVTSRPWVLSWTCDPTVYGVETPFPVTVSVMNGGLLPAAQPLDTTCQAGSTQGTVGVRESGEQWLIVGTGGNGGNWTLTIEVPESDTSAAVLPTPVPTPVPPTPTDTPSPAVATLPFTLTGQGTPTSNTDQFTATVQWHYTARCVNPATDTGSPDALTIRVDQPSDASIWGYAPVGQQLDMYCNGTAVASDTVHPGGFPPGIYGWEVVTGGNWTITVLPKQ
jgi:hypothetical protein